MKFLNRFDYSFDFLGKRKIAMRSSMVFMLIAIASLAIWKLEFGIDFTGGTLVEVGYEQSVELEPIRQILHTNGFSDAVVQHFGTTKDVLIRLGVHEELNNETLSNQILDLLKQNGTAVEMRRVEFVGPQVGSELVEKGGLAVLLTLIGILIYVSLRFEYRIPSSA